MTKLNCLWLLLIAQAILLVRSQEGTKGRLDCALIHSTTDEECRDSGCHGDARGEASTIRGLPACFLEPAKHGYTVTKSSGVNERGHLEAELKIKPGTKQLRQLKNPIENLKLTVDYLSSKMLRVKIFDPAQQRYEVPLSKWLDVPKYTGAAVDYEVELPEGDDLKLTVTRKSTGRKVFDTSLGPMLFADHYLQLATYVASENLYGLGEAYRDTLRHKMSGYETIGMFAKDRGPLSHGEFVYGTHPFYMIVEEDGKANGALLLNSNPMAYTTLPAPGLVLKAGGGIIDLFIIVADDPEDVTSQYTSLIGRPVMPPFWALGFQLCRWGYNNIANLKEVVDRNLKAKMPLDVLYLDIDYMDHRRDFTYDKGNYAGLPAYINMTKADFHHHWTLIIDPAIEAGVNGYHAFDEGYRQDVFIKWPADIPKADRKNPANLPTDKDVIYGKVWPDGPTAFPDFFRNATREWWVQMLKNFHGELAFDAIWIDMNEHSNFNSELWPKISDAFPQFGGLDNLQQSTMYMRARQGQKGEYEHYDVHSLYGWSESEPTQKGVIEATGKRGFVVSRSTYPTSGRFTAHWLGDNSATWAQLRHSIRGMVEFNMFGISFVGADICGFGGKADPDMCRRWLQLGAYYPFSRSHNSINEMAQDPAYWETIGHREVTKSAVAAYRTRYQLLHYIYTLLYRSNVDGQTVVHSLAQQFSQVIGETKDLDNQFMLGKSILVSPFVEENQKELRAYVPPGFWYRRTAEFVELAEVHDDRVTFGDEDSDRPLLFREGSILPVVGDKEIEEVVTTWDLRRRSIELWVLPEKETARATGELFWDDGESVDTVTKGAYNLYQFKLEKCNLTIEPKVHGIHEAPAGEKLNISGIRFPFNRKVIATPIVKLDNATNLKAILSGDGKWIKVEVDLDLIKLDKLITVSFC